jgi:protein-tyrosine-phosphatase
MSKNVQSPNRRYLRLAGILMLSGLLSACGSPFHKVTNYDTGTVLVLPARDVVQNNRPHEKGAGSGAALTSRTVQFLREGNMKPITTDNANFNHLKISDVDAAITDGKRLNADYVLIMTLGEFQNAAPMSFRPDFVWLQEASLYRTHNKSIVWRLKKPWYLQKTNFGNHLPLIGNFARHIADSINESAGPGK